MKEFFELFVNLFYMIDVILGIIEDFLNLVEYKQVVGFMSKGNVCFVCLIFVRFEFVFGGKFWVELVVVLLCDVFVVVGDIVQG